MCNCNESPTINTANDGYNAYTVTTASYTQPAVNNAVTVNVSNNGQFTGEWAIPGQLIYIQNGGYYIVSTSTATSITISYNSDYAAFNQAITAAGNTVVTNRQVSPAGIKGIQGATGPTGPQGPSGSAAFHYSFSLATGSADYKTVSSLTLASAAQTIFPGTSNIPTGIALDSIGINCWMINVGAVGAIEIYDISNSLSIATATSITANNQPNIVYLTINSANLSVNQAVWEIRVSGNLGGGASEFAIASVILSYS